MSKQNTFIIGSKSILNFIEDNYISTSMLFKVFKSPKNYENSICSIFLKLSPINIGQISTNVNSSIAYWVSYSSQIIFTKFFKSNFCAIITSKIEYFSRDKITENYKNSKPTTSSLILYKIYGSNSNIK